MFAMTADLPVPSWKRTRSAPATRPQLSRDLIVETALRLLDADGLDGVSMRRVAEELGTGPASLYAHVANKEELLDLVLDRVAGEIEIPRPDPARWQEQLRELGLAVHATFIRHRDIAAVSLANIPTGMNSLRIADGMMGIMIAGGVPPRVAGWTLDHLALYIAADAYEDSLYTNRQQASGLPMEKFIEQYMVSISDFYRNLPADRFPTLAAHVEDLLGGDGDKRFEFGLDMIVRSLGTYVAGADLPDGAA